MAQLQCTVCGYKLPEESSEDKQCPVCGAGIEQPATATEESISTDPVAIPAGGPDTKWKCTICGYIHTGPTPPDTCPVCGADASKFERLEDDPPEERKATPQQTPPSESVSIETSDDQASASDNVSLFSRGWIESQLVKLHGHPIAVHIPNGVLPVAVLFLLAGMVMGSNAFIQASFFNAVMVLLAMPIVIYAGWVDWQHRFGGNMTSVFKTKIVCAAIVTLTLLVIVIWRLFDPLAGTAYASGRWIYLGLHLIALGAGAVAGFYGGKLIIFPGENN